MLLNFLRSVLSVALCALSMVSATASVHAATITLSANRDTLLMQTAYTANTPPQQLNDVNMGATPYEQIGTAGGNDTTGRVKYLIGFDNSALPAIDHIDSVTLRLLTYHHSASNLDGSKPFTVEVHAITAANADWVEGNGITSGSSSTWDSGSNWNEKSEPDSLNWAGGTGTTATGGLSSPGVDYEVTALASHTFNAIPAEGEAIDFVFTGSSAALTALIENWDTTNPGFVLFHTSPTDSLGNRRLFFYSREATDPSLRPELIIGFTAPVPAPEPSSLALLGVGMLVLAKRRRRR
jgi:hypothetical protein